MNFKIGLFSLKSGVGCTAIAIHIANFLAANERVALIESSDKNEKSEYYRAKTEKEDDGTFIVNNVKFYPKLKIKDENKFPISYEDVIVEPEETIQVFDFGKINFMFEFPTDLNKVYLVSDADESNIMAIQDFYNDVTVKNPKLEFDIVLVGGSRDVTNIFKESLPFASFVISVKDKKEEILDYMFAMKLQMFMRGMGLSVPEYHNNWHYDNVLFYTESEWSELLEKKKQESEPKKKTRFFGAKSKKEKNKEDTKKVIKVKDSNVSLRKETTVIDANVLEFIEYEPVPKPKNTKRVMSARPVPKIEENIDSTKRDNEKEITKKDIIKSSESFEPKQIKKSDIEGEFKEHIIYEHNEKESGILGDLIEGINRGGKFCCNVFIVTKSMRLFVCPDTERFFKKLEALKNVIKSDNDSINYAVLTFNNEDRESRIFSKNNDVHISVFQKNLLLLDKDLREKGELNEEEIKNHKELLLFNETFYM